MLEILSSVLAVLRSVFDVIIKGLKKKSVLIIRDQKFLHFQFEIHNGKDRPIIIKEIGFYKKYLFQRTEFIYSCQNLNKKVPSLDVCVISLPSPKIKKILLEKGFADPLILWAFVKDTQEKTYKRKIRIKLNELRDENLSKSDLGL